MRDETSRPRDNGAGLLLIGHFYVNLWDILEKMGHFPSSDAIPISHVSRFRRNLVPPMDGGAG